VGGQIIIKKIVCFGICRRLVGGVCIVILKKKIEKTKWRNEKIGLDLFISVSTCVLAISLLSTETCGW
jgi:hypothetical protein